jgi:hypothetical protein
VTEPAPSQDDINRALAEQFNAIGPADQPMRLAGAPEEADPTDAHRVPADALKPVSDAKPHIEQSGMKLPEAKVGGVPGWFKLPVAGFTFPRGRQVHFIRFRAEWTDTPWKGERQCCLWSMGVGDKKIALMRSMGDSLRAQDEMLKQTLRIIDGAVVSLEDGSLDVWWDEIGEKCRTLLTRVFAQLHFLKPEQLTDFLAECVDTRSTG